MPDLKQLVIEMRALMDRTPTVMQAMSRTPPRSKQGIMLYIRDHGFPWSVTYANQRVRGDN